MLEIALTAKLTTLAPNIYPVAAPLGFTTPAVIYNRISTNPADDLDGSPAQAFCMVQIDIYDPSQLAALNLAKVIRQSLCLWSDADVSGVSFHDERQWVDDTTQTRLYRVSQDYMVFTALD